ncbi:unnamed protein product [Aspergillus oryzae]|uniref:Unnamed protein product n=2 Tax=Aspergillus oryzae TaxID=5062 RepID=A0AAN4YR78_ASPOZ|nr:unnamed protein product [Aspergillus oryzae]GMF96214.1 unnamed protein product [Aspergillus oryzae]GMG35652.1 unnamed protein product [Aspergillus oryzae]GMG44063.1 unnamed protein product [Aspergillus oryzae var. brunneus]
MADITAVGEENPSPTQDDLQQAAGNGAADNRGTKRSRMSADDDDDDDDKPGRERRKIEIKFIQDKSRRHITFSKRKAGIMKKACLNAPDPTTNENGVEAGDVPTEAPEDVAAAHNNVNAQQQNIPRPAGMHPGYMTNEQQQQMAYYQNLQQQQQAGGQYPGMPVGNRMPPQHQPTA